MIIRQCIQVLAIFIISLIAVNSSTAEQTIQRIEPRVIRTHVRTYGTVTIRLTHEKLFAVDTSANFYQGEIKLRSGLFPVAASEINGEMRLTFNGRITGSRKSRQRTITIKSRNNFNTVRVSSMPRSANPEKACATESHDHSNTVHASAVDQDAAKIKVITISTTADVEWVSRFGSSSNAEIASIINTAEALYERQLGIRFQIVSQSLQTDSTPELDPSLILKTFQSTEPVKANVNYLFTGKDMSGATIGIAYVGSICYAPAYAYGVVQFYNTLTSSVFAHELGHNLGARHDFSNYGSLMYPSISPGTPYFSLTSLNEINTFLSYFSSCLAVEEVPAQNTPAKIKIQTSKRTATVTILDTKNQPIANEPVTFITKGLTRSGKTNSRGKASIIFFNKRGTKIRLTVRSDNNLGLRKTITFKIK
jgi:hypothetical protein